MPERRKPPKRDVKLRLALLLERLYARQTQRPDPLHQLTDQVLYLTDRLRRLRRQRDLCSTRHWQKAGQAVAARQFTSLRELQYLLGTLHTPVSPPVTPVTAASVYRDLLAMEEEFSDVAVGEDLSAVSVVTDPITLEGVALGRFRLELDLAAFARGRHGGDCITAVALDPNPATCNDEVTHPHVQGGQICLGDGSPLVRAALAEGRLYDVFVVVNQVLHTYNDASPYVALDRWNGRSCDQCDDYVSDEDSYSCQACGNLLCQGCEHRCPDCDDSFCRSCMTAKDGDLLCSSCADERERHAAEDDETEDEDFDDEEESKPLTNEETVHETTPT